MSDSILEILLKAQKYVESLGGRLSARVIIWPSQLVNVHVEYEHVPNRGSGGFSRGTDDLGALQKELERTLDYLFGPKWREKK